MWFFKEPGETLHQVAGTPQHLGVAPHSSNGFSPFFGNQQGRKGFYSLRKKITLKFLLVITFIKELSLER
jgi:hypothetical protein